MVGLNAVQKLCHTPSMADQMHSTVVVSCTHSRRDRKVYNFSTSRMVITIYNAVHDVIHSCSLPAV